MSIADRITRARRAQGWSQQRLARAVGAAQTTVSSWERGRTEPSREDARRIAAALDVSAAELELDDRELKRGRGKGAMAPIVGLVGAGAAAQLFGTGQGGLGEVEAPEGSAPETVAVEIRGDSLGALFDEWLVFYDDRRDPVTEDQIGRLCVCGLPDGRILVKKLRRAEGGRYHLLSNTEEPIFDQEVLWAARVTSMRPR